jgi:hypothetical protein
MYRHAALLHRLPKIVERAIGLNLLPRALAPAHRGCDSGWQRNKRWCAYPSSLSAHSVISGYSRVLRGARQSRCLTGACAHDPLVTQSLQSSGARKCLRAVVVAGADVVPGDAGRDAWLSVEDLWHRRRM